MTTSNFFYLFVVKSLKKLRCDANKDNPRSESPYRCVKSIDNFNSRIDSGDTYVTLHILSGSLESFR